MIFFSQVRLVKLTFSEICVETSGENLSYCISWLCYSIWYFKGGGGGEEEEVSKMIPPTVLCY